MSPSDHTVTNRPDWRALLPRLRAWQLVWRALGTRLQGLQPDWRALAARWRGMQPDWYAILSRWTAVLSTGSQLTNFVIALRSQARTTIEHGWRHRAAPYVAAGLIVALLMAGTATIAMDYARRSGEPQMTVERNRIDRLQRLAAEARTRHALDRAEARRHAAEADAKHVLELAEARRHATEADVKHAIELAEAKRQLADLREQITRTSLNLADKSQELTKANVAIEELKKQQAQRRLSYEEKRALIAALGPYRGQKISIAAIYGDDDAKRYAEDLVQTFDAAGWKLGDEGITFQRWDRSPVGLEVTLNEAEARAGRVSVGIGALINAVRRMGLVDGNTVFMNVDVPAGEAQLRVGHRLRAEPTISDRPFSAR